MDFARTQPTWREGGPGITRSVLEGWYLLWRTSRLGPFGDSIATGPVLSGAGVGTFFCLSMYMIDVAYSGRAQKKTRGLSATMGMSMGIAPGAVIVD